MAIKIKKSFWVLYAITGDSGVPDRGVYLMQTNDPEEIKRLFEDIASMCDDRCNAYVISTNAPPF